MFPPAGLQRLHELELRLRSLRNSVQAFTLAVIGVAIGGAGAYWATQALRTMLYQVDVRDPIAYAAAAGVLVLVAVLAATLPARRAARIDPVRALTVL